MTAALRPHRPSGTSEFAAQFAAAQSIGRRERQEDDCAALDLSGDGPERLLFVAADGMGGHQGAAAVTQLSVRRFCEIAQSSEGALGERLAGALAGANDAIAKAAILDGALEGAGCAFLAASVEEGALSWISVGDCSLLLFRGGKLRRLNADHSMRPVLAEMIAAGRVSPRTAALDPRRHTLRSALMGREIRLIDRSPAPMPLRPGDAVILATDGLETLKHRAIARILRRQAGVTPAKLVASLLNAVRSQRRSNQDNTTTIVYRVAYPQGAGHSHRDFGFLVWLVLGLVLGAAAVLAMEHGRQILGL